MMGSEELRLPPGYGLDRTIRTCWRCAGQKARSPPRGGIGAAGKGPMRNSPMGPIRPLSLSACAHNTAEDYCRENLSDAGLLATRS